MTTAIGIDFGTTNSTIAVVGQDGAVSSLTWPTTTGPTDLFRTALYFWSEGRAPRAVVRQVGGPEALERALAGTGEGRFVQSIKTYLGSRTFTETRLYGRRFGIVDIVATFLADLTEGRPESWTSSAVPVVGGRPVVFAGERPDESLAVARLRAAYAQAGIVGVELAYEPLGAAYWYARNLTRDETVLVADFGGGTSDFSVIRFSKANGRLRAEPLAHAGVGVAGDTFDFRLVDNLVAPQLGKNSLYRSFEKRLPFPAYIHAAFAQWHQLSWLKTPKVMADLRELEAASEAPDAIEKLIAFLDFDLGFELYQAVGRLKAQLSEAERAELDFESHGLTLKARVTRSDFERFIAPDLDRIGAAADEALRGSKLSDRDVDAVFLTGGTSFVPAVRRLFADRFGAHRLQTGHAFQSVASGLALLAADREIGRIDSRLARVGPDA